MKSLFAVALCLFVVAIVADEEAAKTDVVVITPENFPTEGVWLIKFFAPWCGHCKKLAPIWEQLATLSKDVFNVGEVDCTVTKDLCTEHGVRGFPTVKYFNNGGDGEDCRAPRTIEGYVSFIEGKHTDLKGKIAIPESEKKVVPEEAPQKPAPPPAAERPADSENVILNDNNWSEKVTAEKPWIVKFYAPWCGHCKRLAPTWEEMAKHQKEVGKFNVGEVDCTQDDTANLKTKFAIRGFPTVLIFKDGPDAEPIKYPGARTQEAFEQYMDEIMTKTEDNEEPAVHSEL